MSSRLQLPATLALVVALAGGARGHGVAPPTLTMTPSSSDFIYVVDGGSCAATITATSTNPAIDVHALDMSTGLVLPGGGATATVPNRVDQVFLVVAPDTMVPLNGDIEICWIGEHWPGGPCNENNCSPYSPTKVNVSVRTYSLSAGNRLSSGIAGDPINTSSGELFFREAPDLDLGGAVRVALQRYYGGHLELDGIGPGPLGPNWRHGYEWSWESVGNAIHVTTPAGRIVRFETDFFAPGTWTQVGTEDLSFELMESGPDYVLANTLTGFMYTFDSAGRLTQIEDQNGNALTLTYNFADLTQVTDGRGRTLTFTYNTGTLTSATDGTRTVSFTYTAGGSLETVTDTESNVTTYAYDPTYPTWIASKTFPEGNVRHAQTYTPSGQVASQTAEGAHTTTLTYDAVAGTTTITDPLANTQVHTHTASGEMTAHQDESGSPAPIGYDANERRSTVTDRNGNTTSWSWHAGGKVAQIVEASGAITTFGYTVRIKNGFTFHDLTSITRADGRTETFTYDANGNLTGHRDTRGNDWSWTYDASGNVLTGTNPATGVATMTWNADGTLDTSTDDAGNLTTYAYDGLKRVTTVTQADTTTLTYTYDTANRVATVTDELSDTWTLAYDRNGNLTSVTDPTTQAWTFAYDTMDRLETVTDPLGRTLTATFDELGRPRTITGGNGKTTTYGYDTVGNLIAVTNHKGETWTRGYDAERTLTSLDDPLTRSTTFTPDAMGRYASVTTPLGNQTTFTYDVMGRVTQVRGPSLATTTLGYDAMGLVASIVLPSGASSTFGRNALGLATQITDPRGNPWTFAYDDQGRRTSHTDPLGNQVTYQYDQRNRCDRIDFPGGLGFVDVTYDGAGRLTQRSYSDGTVIDVAYDPNGRVTSGTDLTLGYDIAGRMTSSNGITIGRNPGGLISNVTFAPGKFVNYAYDDDNRLSLIFDHAGGVTLFTYDAAGQLTNVLRGNQVNTLYVYDADGRVTRVLDQDPFADHTQADHVLSRDPDGRVVNATRILPVEGTPAIASQSYTYDAAGQVSGFTYDALGRLTNDGLRAYAWNLATHLTSFTEGGATVAYTYDAFGNVRSRTAQGVTERYVWNYALGLPSISVVRQGGTDLRYHVHTPSGDLLYSMDAATDARTFYHYDEVGNTVLLTDDTGLAIDAWHHTPAGVEIARLGANGTPFTFGGQVGVFEESDSGLYRMRARLYDAATGRFLSRDPVEAGDPRGINPYQYAYGDPLRYVDPRGTTPEPGEPTQVLIESRFLEIQRSATAEFGFDWTVGESFDTFDSALGAIQLPRLQSSTVVTRITAPTQETALGVVLRAIGKNERAELLTAPRLLVVDPQPSSTRSLGEIPILTALFGASSAPAPSTIDGIVLDTRPIVSDDRRFITIELNPRVVTATAGSGGSVPGNYTNAIRKLRDFYKPRIRYFPPFSLAPRTIVTDVQIRDGGTFAIAGLLSNDTVAQDRGVPFLGDIPYLGRLFRTRSSLSGQELTIFVTARIIVTGEEE